ncbi:lipopolysaccharide biosynthesis protein [Cupriavidus gilardii]|uniref:lipopolysaccharide biosynthesis protein n=1 Tax=Cupriavidus gilardii TaxID=82541 RepID=UPI0007E319DF|nr:oligosaccharide flippase family protein [Cupriavidus gilardii]
MPAPQPQSCSSDDSAASGIVLGSIWSFGFRALAAFSGLIVAMLITRQLSQPDAGRYFLLLSVVSVAAVVLGGGLNFSVVRLIAEAQAQRRPARTLGVIDLSIRFVAAAAVLTAIVMAVPPIRVLLVDWLAYDGRLPWIALWLWIAASALQTLLAEIFRGLRNLFLASLFSGAASAVLSVLLLTAFRWLVPASLDTVVVAIAAATLAGATVAAVCLWRAREPLGTSIERDARRLWQTSAPLWVTQLTLLVLLQADIWILQGAGDSAGVALYGTAVRMTVLLTLPLTVLNAALMPVISARHALARHAELQRLLRDVASLAALPAALAVLVFAGCGEPLLSLLFGDAYRAAAPLMLVLSLGQLVNVLCGSAAYTLMMTGRQRDMMWITIAAGALTIGLGLAAVRSHGALGVAWASAIGLALQSLAMWLRVRQTRGLWTHASWRGLLQPLATLRQLR